MICLAGAAWAQLFPADRVSISKDSTTTLVEEQGKKVLVTDLSALRAAPQWFQGDTICTTGTWTPVPAGRYLVRYQVAVNQVGGANISAWGEVLGTKQVRGSSRLAWQRWLGVDFTKAGEYQPLEVMVDVPEAMSIQPLFLWRRSTKEAGDITQMKLASIEITPAPLALVVEDVLANKVHYQEGEAGSGLAKVLNCTDQVQTARLLVRLFTDLDSKGTLVYDQPVTVPARGEQQVTFDFPKLGTYGYELRAEIVDTAGKAVDARADYFTVLNNVLEVGLTVSTPFRDTYVPYPIGHKGNPAEYAAWCQSTARWAEAVRRLQQNTMELFAWGPADCIKLVPQQEDWDSGQTKYPGSISRLKTLINECHLRGMTVQAYIQSLWGIDDDGSYLQEHPEYFAYNSEGRPQGWDLHNMEPVDDHIAGMLKSIEMFGWDGARWDGHFDYMTPYDNLKTLLGEKIDVSKRDEQVATINDKIRKAINGKYPNFTWGHNWNDQVENFAASKEITSICANGSWIMNEAIKDSESPTSGTHKWVEYAARITNGNRILRAQGGLNLLVAPPQYFQAGSQVLYKTLLPYAGRSYLYGSAFYDRMPIGYDLPKFMTRYARYLWGKEFVSEADASPFVSVKSPGDIWWKAYFSQKVTPNGVEQVLGLINPPVVPAVTIEPAGSLPAPQQNITVTCMAPKGMKTATAVLLSPDRHPYQQALPVTLTGKSATVVVPELRFWDVLYLKWSK
ncbi:MAG TPA: hypothetical protein VGM23_14415 [Armatimonadota bacterium]